MSEEARRQTAGIRTEDRRRSEESVTDARGLRRAASDAEPQRPRCPGVRDLTGDFSEQTGANFG